MLILLNHLVNLPKLYEQRQKQCFEADFNSLRNKSSNPFSNKGEIVTLVLHVALPPSNGVNRFKFKLKITDII